MLAFILVSFRVCESVITRVWGQLLFAQNLIFNRAKYSSCPCVARRKIKVRCATMHGQDVRATDNWMPQFELQCKSCSTLLFTDRAAKSSSRPCCGAAANSFVFARLPLPASRAKKMACNGIARGDLRTVLDGRYVPYGIGRASSPG